MIGKDFSGNIELYNQYSILNCIRKASGDVSRATIAKEIGLSRTTVSSVVNRLISLDLVKEVNKFSEPTTRGRPGVPVTLTEDVWYAAGATLIDLDLIFVLMTLRGEIWMQFSLPLADETADTFLSTLEQGFRILIEKCPGRLLPRLGVGSPGAIHNGKVTTAFDMNWSQVPISDYLYEKLHLSAEVINRHWASCLAEYHASGDCTSMIYVGISTGIAAAIIIDGVLFTGAYHNAGEIGHTIVNPEGPMCTCGRRGCLQAVSSERALVEIITNYYKIHCCPVVGDDKLWEVISSGRCLEIDDICRAARNHHPVAQQQLDNAAKYLGLSVSNLTGMFNPQCVVLGGSLVDRAGKRFTKSIIDHVFSYSHIEVNNEITVYPWTQGRRSGAVGAAYLVLDQAIQLAGSICDKE